MQVTAHSEMYRRSPDLPRGSRSQRAPRFPAVDATACTVHACVKACVDLQRCHGTPCVRTSLLAARVCTWTCYEGDCCTPQTLGTTVLETYGYNHEHWWRFAPVGFLIFFIIVMNGVTAVALRLLSGGPTGNVGKRCRLLLLGFCIQTSVLSACGFMLLNSMPSSMNTSECGDALRTLTLQLCAKPPPTVWEVTMRHTALGCYACY